MTGDVRDRQPIYPPDLSGRPRSLTRERIMRIQPAALYRAWTQEWDRWFTTPGSVLMRAGVNEPFFFAVEFEGQVYPHYGRFLKLVPDRRVELTWLAATTKGFETIVTVELAPHEAGTRLTLTHSGFPDEESMEQHDEGWRSVLEQQEERLLGGP